MKFTPGDIIRFTYKHQSVDEHTGPPEKEVLVLHPNWHWKVHGIDLKRLSPGERKVLEFLLDPKKKNTPSKIPLINNIRKRMDPISDIQNPMTFYSKFVKPFLNKKDAYRQYIPKLMSGVTRISQAKISTGKPDTKDPLFGKVPDPLAKPQAEPKALSPIDVMKQASDQKSIIQQAQKLSPSAAQNILKRFGGGK
jgi:hypothetical protein